MLGRELLLTALTPLAFASSSGVGTLEVREAEAVVAGGVSSLHNVFAAAQASVQDKNQLPKIKPHYNDMQVMGKIKKKLGLSCNDTYIDYGVALSEWAMSDLLKNQAQWEQSLGQVHHSPNSIIFGDSKSAFSGFQPLKIEKYKYGKQFDDLKAQQDIKMDERWVALVMAGFLISYSIYSEGEMIFSTVPEEVVLRASTDFNWLNYVTALTRNIRGATVIQRYLNLAYDLRIRPDLHHAYSMLLALYLKQQTKQSGLSLLEAPPVIFNRVQFTGRNFSLLEKTPINVSILAPFVERISLSQYAESVLIQFLKCTLTQFSSNNRYCSERFGDFSLCNRLSKALYDAAVKTRPASEVVYMMARSSPENSPLREERFLTDVYDALTSY
ncbi:MAG: hypothetical protein QXI02_05270 [Candidatus Caldarchaeum sp.]